MICLAEINEECCLSEHSTQVMSSEAVDEDSDVADVHANALRLLFTWSLGRNGMLCFMKSRASLSFSVSAMPRLGSRGDHERCRGRWDMVVETNK